MRDRVEDRIPKSEFLRKLSYNPISGDLTWIGESRNSGKIAGQLRKSSTNSYLWVGIGYLGEVHKVFAHRICWMLETGDWPEGDIDHLNGNGLDNKFSNLRSVSRSINNKNHAKQRNNTSGLSGVSWNDRLSKWRVYGPDLLATRKQVTLGITNDFFEACCLRKSFESKSGFTMRHGRKRITE